MFVWYPNLAALSRATTSFLLLNLSILCAVRSVTGWATSLKRRHKFLTLVKEQESDVQLTLLSLTRKSVHLQTISFCPRPTTKAGLH